jgi:hypothetical protein
LLDLVVVLHQGAEKHWGSFFKVLPEDVIVAFLDQVLKNTVRWKLCTSSWHASGLNEFIGVLYHGLDSVLDLVNGLLH